MKYHAFVFIMISNLFTCNSAKNVSKESRNADSLKGTAFLLSQNQTTYYYMPATSTLTGLLQKEDHYNRPGFGETPDIDMKDTVFILLLKRPIDIYLTNGSDSEMFDNVKDIDTLQIDSRAASLHNYVGKVVTIAGKIIQDPSPNNYYKVVLTLEKINPADSVSKAKQ